MLMQAEVYTMLMQVFETGFAAGLFAGTVAALLNIIIMAFARIIAKA